MKYHAVAGTQTMTLHKCISISLLVLLLVGCTGISASHTLETKVTATPFFIPSLTPSEEPPSPTTTSSLPTLPRRPVIQACVAQNNSQQALAAHGVLVLKSFDDPNLKSEGWLYDVERRILNKLPVQGYFMNFVGVSPDRKKLLYHYDPGPDYALALADFRGRVIKSFSYPRTPGGSGGYFSWLNADTIRGAQGIVADDSLQLYRYDPITGDYTQLRTTDWPDAYKGKALDWGIDNRAIRTLYLNGANMIYDPTTTRLVYPKTGGNISLTDVESGAELAATQLPRWGRLPRWSDDGRNLVLIADTEDASLTPKEEFFIVSRDGVGGFRRLTSLTDEFEQVYIADYAWSPDGQQIAFWLNTLPGDQTRAKTGAELALLDIDTGQVTSLCVDGISGKFNRTEDIIHMIEPQPVWSPDGNQVMITQLDPNGKKYHVLIVDIPNARAHKIVENLEPIGWMTTEP